MATNLDNNVYGMFETMCRLSHKKDVEITVTIRIKMQVRNGIKKERGQHDL